MEDKKLQSAQQKEQVEALWKEALEKRHKKRNPLYDSGKEECYLSWENEIPVIRFHAFEKMIFVNAAFSTRFGGVSKGHLAQLNLGFSRGDSEEIVSENYQIFCRAIGVKPENLVLSDQVHDTRIAYVTKEDVCQETIKKKLRGIDGLFTDKREVCLATSYADCVPLFFVDPEKKVIASSHSGWRGTVGKIGAKTVAAMEQRFGSKRKDIVAVIGPSICQSCYEVSQDVIDAFAKSYSEISVAQMAVCTDEKEKKYHLDLWAANFSQLKEAGLLPEHIHVAGICTCCNDKLLFSHRASHGKRGNLNGFLAMR